MVDQHLTYIPDPRLIELGERLDAAMEELKLQQGMTVGVRYTEETERISQVIRNLCAAIKDLRG